MKNRYFDFNLRRMSVIFSFLSAVGNAHSELVSDLIYHYRDCIVSLFGLVY